MADTAHTPTYTVTADGIGSVPVTVTERGEGRPFLLLHGGAGPQSVDGFAALLASSGPARVLTPLHPGFGGSPRPEGLDSMPGLARLYGQLLADLGLTGVTDEGFYVVSGTARFTVGETSYDAPAGTLVMIPPGAPHTFANPGDGTVVLLNTFTPDLYVQYFRDIRDMIAAGQPPSPEAVLGVMARYATEPATD